MTYEEAKNWLGKQPHHFFTLEEAKLDQECREVINEALEKQIPRTPIVDIYGDLDCTCPTCHRVFKKIRKGKMSAYCSDCGQKLDWSDDNDT